MTLIEKIASFLGLFKIPVGRLSPENLITDVCSSFVQADELQLHGIEIEGRKLSTIEFIDAAEKYIGFDLVAEVLDTEVRDGINIHEHAIMLIQNTIKMAKDNPNYYNRIIQEITSDIMQAQTRLNS